ncbi:cysteine protease [Cystobasidiomycetes sp. EMM_F5]
MSGQHASTAVTWNEKLKSAQALADKALQSEHRGDLDGAYSLNIQTAQSYLWLIRNTDDVRAKETLKAASTKILLRAEKIKEIKRDARPPRIQRLSKTEQEAVLESSDDEDAILLADSQKARLATFRRIADLDSATTLIGPNAQASSIRQAYRVFPQDAMQLPTTSTTGMHRVKLNCNGAVREQIIIDDLLPVDDDGALLCASMSDASGFWPACMEKAYLRLFGSYGILGSDPSIDTHPKFRSQQNWERLTAAFDAGACLLAVGSGRNSVDYEGVHFASEHAYAVLVDVYLVSDPQEQLLLAMAEGNATITDDNVALDIQLAPSASLEHDEIWILCSRHLDDLDSDEYMALHLTENLPSRLKSTVTNPYLSERAVKYRPEQPQAKLNALLTRKGKKAEVRYTLTVLSDCERNVADIQQQISGKWGRRSSGGNQSLHGFTSNPQYRIDVPVGQKLANLQVKLSSNGTAAINVKLFQTSMASALDRIQHVETANCIADSDNGAYTRSEARLNAADLKAGSYILIPSTFEAGQCANFSISLRSTFPLNVQALPAEDAGRFVRVLSGQWCELLPTNGANLTRGNCYENPRYAFKAPTRMTVK